MSVAMLAAQLLVIGNIELFEIPLFHFTYLLQILTMPIHISAMIPHPNCLAFCYFAGIAFT